MVFDSPPGAECVQYKSAAWADGLNTFSARCFTANYSLYKSKLKVNLTHSKIFDMNSITYFLLFVLVLVSDTEATKGKGGGGFGGMSYGGGGYGAAPQQIIYVPAPQPVFYHVPAPRPVSVLAPSYGGSQGGYSGSQGGHGGGQSGYAPPVSGYGGSSAGAPVHVHVHSAPVPPPVSSSYQPVPAAPYGGGHGVGPTGGYQESTGYGSAPIPSYHQAPSVDSYGAPPQSGGY